MEELEKHGSLMPDLLGYLVLPDDAHMSLANEEWNLSQSRVISNGLTVEV